jgi:sulfopyruvate decarboxylase TPP-binding subunit
MLVTMRGEAGEFNPWQVPMGRATAEVLGAMGVEVRRVEEAESVGPALEGALATAFGEDAAVAVQLAQSLIGIKSFQEQADR